MTAAYPETTSATEGESATSARLRARLRSHVGIDTRALGAFRIGLGLVILLDLLVLRVPGLGTFYTDTGVFPRSALAETAPVLARWSPYAVSGSVWVQALLIGGTAIVATCLLVGYRPRLAAIGSALLLASLYARNPYVVNGGDTILVSVLFLAAFLPLDAAWSLGGRHRPTGRIVSTATATILLHLVGIYVINAVLKFQSDAWMNGVAVRRIFQLEDFVYLLGPTLAEYPLVLTVINWLWVAVLSASVLLVIATDRLRIAVVAAFVGAHLGMAATMRLGAFPFVMTVSILLFLPPRVWDRVDRLVAERGFAARLESLVSGDSGDGDRSRASDRARSRLVRRGTRLVTTGLLICFFVTVLSWQVIAADLAETPSPGAEGNVESASWAFFAPEPPDSYSWYVVEADRESGASTDLVDGDEPDFERPPDAMDRYPTTLWKRYGTKIQGASESQFESAATYFCERAPADVESVTIYRVEQRVDADGPVGEPIPKQRAAVACR